MADALDFSRECELQVQELVSEGRPIENATLKFGGGKGVRLSCANLYHGALLSELTGSVVKVKSVQGKVYTLLGCAAYHGLVLADFLIDGDVGDGFRRASVHFSEVSHWYLAGQRIDGTVGETLTWQDAPPLFDVTVATDGEAFRISTHREASISTDGGNSVFREDIVFQFDFDDARPGGQGVREKILDLAALFGILLTAPVSIVNVWVQGETSRWHAMYFPFYELSERRSGPGVRETCLISRRALDESWRDVMQGFFASPSRQLIWRRLAGMQRYNGFWEFRILGYVSLLDQITHRLTAGVQASGDKRMAVFRQRIASACADLTAEQTERVMEAAARAFPAQRKPNFPQRFQLALDRTDRDIVAMLNFTEEEFRRIKKLRDGIAHADETIVESNDLTWAAMIVNKLTLLLTWWMCEELGIALETFAIELERSFSQLRLHANLSHAQLARITGDAQFFAVSAECMAEVKQSRSGRTSACFTRSPSGTLHYSERYAERFREWMLRVRPAVGPMSHGQILGVGDHQVEYVPRAYLEAEGVFHELHGMYIIDESKGNEPAEG